MRYNDCRLLPLHESATRGVVDGLAPVVSRLKRRSMYSFKIRFTPDQITEIASRYADSQDDPIIENVIPGVLKSRYLTKDNFLALCNWKTVRTRNLCRSNDSNFIKEISAIALNSNNEKIKIEALTLLDGVNYPTASTILHFSTKFKYPILDYLALWSLRTEVPKKYTFDFWWAYTKYCRKLAGENGVSLRTLDRALWQYSKENQ